MKRRRVYLWGKLSNSEIALIKFDKLENRLKLFRWFGGNIKKRRNMFVGDKIRFVL